MPVDGHEHAPSELLLAADDISVNYGTRRVSSCAVRSFRVDIARGEIVAIIGETGSGKSTAALAIIGLMKGIGAITRGQSLFDGQDLLKMTEVELRRIRGKDIGVVFQNPRAALNPIVRVGDELRHVIQAHRDMGRGDARDLAIHALESVGISDPVRRMRAYPHELSGGMAQRVLIAMAIVHSPRLLIADEPTTGLDLTIQAQILDLLKFRAGELKAGVLLVTHDLGIVAHYCDRAVVMNQGEIVEVLPVRDLFTSPSHPYTRQLVESIPQSARALTGSKGGQATRREP